LEYDGGMCKRLLQSSTISHPHVVRDRGCDGAALFREFIAGRKDDAGVPQGAFRMARALYDFIFLGQFDFH